MRAAAGAAVLVALVALVVTATRPLPTRAPATDLDVLRAEAGASTATVRPDAAVAPAPAPTGMTPPWRTERTATVATHAAQSLTPWPVPQPAPADRRPAVPADPVRLAALAMQADPPTAAVAAHALLAHWHAEPHAPQGDVLGYVLRPLGDPTVFAGLGLAPGDVLTEVERMPLATLFGRGMDLNAVLSGLNMRTQLELTVQRGSERHRLRLDLPSMRHSTD